MALLTILDYKYDGYGTLKVLNKEFDSAVRVHSIGIQIDSIYTTSAYTTVITLMDKYDWYFHSLRFPVLTLFTYWNANRNGSGYDTVSRSDYAKLIQTSGTLSIPPPPAFHNTTANMAENSIVVHNANGRGISYGLYDSQGRLILQSQPNNNSGGDIQIPDGNISPGVYILKLQNNRGGTKSFKLVKDQ